MAGGYAVTYRMLAMFQTSEIKPKKAKSSRAKLTAAKTPAPTTPAPATIAAKKSTS